MHPLNNFPIEGPRDGARSRCRRALPLLLVAVGAASLSASPAARLAAPLAAPPAGRLAADEGGATPIGGRVADLRYVDLAGAAGRLSDHAVAAALVVVVRVAGSPDAATSGAQIAAFESAFAPQRIAFLHVDPSATSDAARAAADAAAHRFGAPTVLDRAGRFARAFALEREDDVVLLDAARRLRWRGPLGPHAEAALRALLAGERIEPAPSGGAGRPLVLAPPALAPPNDPLEVTPPVVTWSNRIAALTAARCERCHCSGGAGPFPLSSAEEFAGAADMIRAVLQADLMPPWVATADSGPFRDSLRLLPEEKLDLLRWLQDGAPIGDPDFRHEPLVAPRGWQIGEPDLIVESPRSVPIPSTGIVDYLTLDAPSGLAEDRWVSAVQILCEHPEVCHHIGVRQIPPGGRGQEFVAFYLPGTGPSVFPEGFALQLKAGATIRFDFHYTPNGAAVEERTRIGFKFAKEPPQQRINGRILSRNVPLRIPAGDPAHEVIYEHEIAFDTSLRRLIPHMHLRGRSVDVELIAPDGTVTRPLTLARWDPDWQFVYEFETPLAVVAGSRIRCRHLFDNSAANPRNPDPSALVRGGPQIWDEMACIYFESFNRADQPPPKWRGQSAAERKRGRKGGGADDDAIDSEDG